MSDILKTYPLQSFLGIQLFISLIYLLFRRLGLSRISVHHVLIIFLVPVFGFLSALCIDWLYLRKKAGQKDIPLEGLNLSLGENITHQLPLKEDEDASAVIPLEEALLINDVNTRRSIMLEILHKDPNQYIEQLKMARLNQDTEISHYAATTIMEAQREYEMELQKSMAKYHKNPKNLEALEKYIKVLKDYIGSGLLEGALLQRQRARLSQMLTQRLGQCPDDKDTWFDLLDNEIRQKHFTQARETVGELQKKWPEDENVWLQTLRLCVESKDQKLYMDMLEQLASLSVNWSAKGRERFSFFLTGDYVMEAAAAQEILRRR